VTMFFLVMIGLLAFAARTARPGQDRKAAPVSDETVRGFLESRRGQWRDMNVPEADAKVLYDLIIKRHYTRALEIGTSTGHSGIWIAWALSKTGGKLITIEIDEDRFREAVDNFKKAGLGEYVDARLADAHELVPRLQGSFDFVFCDADKDWYTEYLKAAWPKIAVGGCFTAHNVTGWMSGIREFLDYARSLPDGETTIERASGSGISLTFKRSGK
jgi:caffeoyl-CoA O-methyltransferase